MCLAAFLTNRSTNMLVAVGEKSGRLNYEELMADVFGNLGIHVFSIFVVVLAFGSASAYLIIVGDTIPEVVKVHIHAEGTRSPPGSRGRKGLTWLLLLLIDVRADVSGLMHVLQPPSTLGPELSRRI